MPGTFTQMKTVPWGGGFPIQTPPLGCCLYSPARQDIGRKGTTLAPDTPCTADTGQGRGSVHKGGEQVCRPAAYTHNLLLPLTRWVPLSQLPTLSEPRERSATQGHSLEGLMIGIQIPRGFPGGADHNESACQCRRHRRHRFNPWVRKIPWRRTWQPTPVFLPGKSHGQRSLAVCRGAMGSQRVRHDLAAEHPHIQIPGPSWYLLYLWKYYYISRAFPIQGLKMVLLKWKANAYINGGYLDVRQAGLDFPFPCLPFWPADRLFCTSGW